MGVNTSTHLRPHMYTREHLDGTHMYTTTHVRTNTTRVHPRHTVTLVCTQCTPSGPAHTYVVRTYVDTSIVNTWTVHAQMRSHTLHTHVQAHPHMYTRIRTHHTHSYTHTRAYGSTHRLPRLVWGARTTDSREPGRTRRALRDRPRVIGEIGSDRRGTLQNVLDHIYVVRREVYLCST